MWFAFGFAVIYFGTGFHTTVNVPSILQGFPKVGEVST